MKINTPSVSLSNMEIVQFGINNDKETTGHKLQGMLENCLCALDYNYGTENWIYVILSRVREMKEFYFILKLDKNKLKKNTVSFTEISD